MLAIVVAILIAATALWYGGNPPEITAAISMITWWAIALGVTFGLIPVSGLSKSAVLPAALLASLAVLTGLSLLWTNNEGLAFEKTVQMTCIVGLFVLALLCSKPGSAKDWLRGIAVGLAFLTVLAIFSRYFPGLGDDDELRETLFGSAGRLSWPLGYWNAAGAVAAMAIITVGWFAAVGRSPRWRAACVAALPVFFLTLYLTSSRGGLGALVIGVALLLLIDTHRKGLLIAFVLGGIGGTILVLVTAPMYDLVHAETTSNARIEGVSLLAASIAVTAAVAVIFRRYEGWLQSKSIPKPTRNGWVVIGVLCVIGLVLVNPVRHAENFIATPDANQAQQQNLTNHRLLSANGNGRWQYWTAATSAFKSEPLVGIGAGGYRNYYTNHRENPIYGQHPHSLPLAFLGELGLIGFLLATGFLLFVLHVGWRRFRSGRRHAKRQVNAPDSRSPFLVEAIPPFAALILTGLTSMSIDWTSQFPVIAAPVLISMAALVGPATIRRSSGEPPEPIISTREGKVPGRLVPRDLASVLTIIVAGGAIFISTWGFGISYQTEKSRNALAEGDNTKALEAAREAVELAPWSATTLLQLAAVQELDNDYIAALNSLDRAAGQAPLDSTPWFGKGRVYEALGDSSSTFESLVVAKTLDPFAPYFELARVRAEQEAAALEEEARFIEEAKQAEREARQAAREQEKAEEAAGQAGPEGP